MKEIVIAKAVTYSAKVGGGTISGYNEVDLLLPGAVAIFTEDEVLITTATLPAAIANVKQFYIAVGQTDKNGSNRSYVSQLVDRSAFHRSYCAYVAPVNQAIYVGYDGAAGTLNLPGTLIPGTIASMSIGVEKEGVEPHVMWSSYQHMVTSVDTDTTIVTDLVAQINADTRPWAKWTAAVIGVSPNLGISITSTENGQILLSSVDELLQYATRGILTPIVYGKGTPAQIAAEELETSSQDGNTNRVLYPAQFYSKPSQVDTTAQYATYTFEWEQERRQNHNAKAGFIKKLTVAVPAGTQLTALTTIFTTILLQAPNQGNGGSSSLV